MLDVGPCSPIRQDRFTSRDQAQSLQFEYWKDQISPIVDVERPFQAGSDEAKGPFLADVLGYDLGKFHLAAAQVDMLTFHHTENHVRQHATDHWLFEYRKSGSSISRAGDRVLQSTPGSMAVKSLAYPYYGNSTDTSVLYLFINRETFPEFAEYLDSENHKLIKGAMGELLKEFFISLETYLPTLPNTDINIINDAITSLIRAYIKQIPQHADLSSAVASTQFERVRRYIQTNIKTTSLDPISISNALGISRRQLYYIFENRGGVTNYIRSRRLTACHDAIANHADHRPIHTIAFEFGFGNPAQFSRQFRAQFGYSPSDAREARLTAYSPKQSRPKTFVEWLNQTR